ncbi:Tetratricopeptide repeat-containing protein [Epilithonimonas mollis]|uniref:Tetratricopeptide repeat-containing protein n=1 Tax=Epilithonimonas mollis TaxID=216903 RepID=A0A1M6RU75_9FLAO|nr:Tetratricopeptide repeat-containing protein [Epilithonimonas mollis]
MRNVLAVFFIFLNVCFYAQDSQKNSDAYVKRLINLIRGNNNNRIKSMSYIQEALRFEKEIADSTRVELYVTAGNCYKDQESYYLALSYYYKALEIKNEKKSNRSFSILNNIGGCYYFMGNYKKARHFWELALKKFESNKASQNVEGSLIYNNLAVLEKEHGNYARALEMLKEFKKRNEILKDTFNIIIAYENIAGVNVKLKESDLAISNLSEGIRLAKKIRSDYDQASLYTDIGNVYLSQPGRKDSAYYYLSNAFNIANRSDFSDIKLASSEKLVSYFEKQNDYKNALYYLHIAKSLSEATINKENAKKVSRLESEFEEKNKQKELLQQQKRRERYFISGIVLLLLFSVIVFLMFKLQKSKSEKKAAENKLLSKKLEEKNKELANNAVKMMQASEIFQTTQKELKEMDPKYEDDRKVISRIIMDFKKGSQALNNSEFDKLFIETDEDFYKKLLEKFPSLTKNELRLCVFLRQNLSSKEISAITKQSPHSIVVARSRLRKKLGLEESQSISNFLIRF